MCVCVSIRLNRSQPSLYVSRFLHSLQQNHPLSIRESFTLRFPPIAANGDLTIIIIISLSLPSFLYLPSNPLCSIAMQFTYSPRLRLKTATTLYDIFIHTLTYIITDTNIHIYTHKHIYIFTHNIHNHTYIHIQPHKHT